MKRLKNSVRIIKSSDSLGDGELAFRSDANRIVLRSVPAVYDGATGKASVPSNGVGVAVEVSGSDPSDGSSYYHSLSAEITACSATVDSETKTMPSADAIKGIKKASR